jgi:hypothetical protein
LRAGTQTASAELKGLCVGAQTLSIGKLGRCGGVPTDSGKRYAPGVGSPSHFAISLGSWADAPTLSVMKNGRCAGEHSGAAVPATLWRMATHCRNSAALVTAYV